MTVKSKLSSVYAYLPSRLMNAIACVCQYELEQISEIRLRRNKKLTLTAYSKEFYLTENGVLTNSEKIGIGVTDKDIEYIFRLAFKDSIHSFHREIVNGYITVNGGCRIGFCGTAVINTSDHSKIENIKDISSLNIRISREIIGSADEIYEKIFAGLSTSLIIIGSPCSGKTTLLRDLTRKLGNNYTVSLIDERNEIAAVYDGIPQNDIGAKTDVFSSYNKFEGIIAAVKVMSPTYLICDEIGSREDLKALEYALNSGVHIVATCHSASYEQARKKPVIKKLVKMQAFENYAVLGNGVNCGKLVQWGRINTTEQKEKQKC